MKDLLLGIIFAIPGLILGIFAYIMGTIFKMVYGIDQLPNHTESKLDTNFPCSTIKNVLTKWSWFHTYIWGYPDNTTYYDFLRNPFEKFSQTYVSTYWSYGLKLIDIRFYYWKWVPTAPPAAKKTTGPKIAIPIGKKQRPINDKGDTALTSTIVFHFGLPYYRDAKWCNSAVSIQFGVNLGISWLQIPILVALGLLLWFNSFAWTWWYLLAILLFFPWFTLFVQPVTNKFFTGGFGFFEDHNTPHKANAFGKFIFDNKKAQTQWNPGVIAPQYWEGHT